MIKNKEKILEIIENTARKHDCFVVAFELRGNDRMPVVEAYIDNVAGLTIDDYSMLSREILEEIDAKELLGGNYRLDVSSPGLDRPLKFLDQYFKHINRKFEVSYLNGEEPKTFEGKLLGIEGNNLRFSCGKEQIDISFEQIQTATVKISFS